MEPTNKMKLYDYTHRAIDRAVQSLTEKEEDHAIKTGFPELDLFIKGLQQGEVILVGGRPSMGKTAFALSVMENVAVESGQTCIFFSAGTSAVQVAKRLIRIDSGIPFRSPERISAEEKGRIMASAERIKSAPIIIEDKQYPSVEWIIRACDQYRDMDIRLIVIDYLQLITNDEFPEKQVNMSHVILALKSLAAQVNCPVMVLTQLTRAPETRKEHRPLITDIRDYRNIVDEVDKILLLYKDDYYYMPDKNPDVVQGQTELIIARQINGPAGMILLMYRKETGRFMPHERIDASVI